MTFFKTNLHFIKLVLIQFLFVSIVLGQQLTRIESVEYDSTQNRYLISNRNSIIAQDANGQLTTFGSGAVAEFGMEIINGVLFAIAQGNVKAYDLTTGNEVADINVPRSNFLNGITHDDKNNLYVTDFGGSKIYKINVSDINNPIVTEFVPNTNTSPNGIVFDPGNNRLVFVNWGNNATINAVDLSDSSLSTLDNTNLTNCDGIVIDKQGHFYVSSWSPQRITEYDNQFTSPITLSETNLDNPADIAYNSKAHEIAIPNSGDNTLTILKLQPVNIILKEFQSSLKLKRSDKFWKVNLFQKFSEYVKLQLFTTKGKIAKTIFSGTLPVGKHQWKINPENIDPGRYFLKYSTSKETISHKITFQ